MIRPLIDGFYRYKHVNWALADQVMVSGANFLTNVLLARYLGLADFGRFALAWMLVLFLHNLHESFVVSPMVSIGPQQSDHGLRKYYGAVFVNLLGFNLLTFFALLVLLAGVAQIIPEWNIGKLILPILLAVVANQLQHFCRRYYFAVEKPFVAFVSDAVRYLGHIALIYLLARYWTLTSATALLVLAFTGFCGAAPTAFAAMAQQFDRQTLRAVTARHWLFSKWLLSSTVISWASGHFLTAVTGPLLGTAAVGAMRSTQNIVGISNIITFGMENIIPVRAAQRLAAGGVSAMNAYLLKFALLGTPVVGFVLGVAAIGADFWVTLLYGEEFRAYGYLVVWWSGIHFMLFLSMPLRIGLRTLERTKPLFYLNLILMGVTLVAFYPLIRYGGILGVMVGTAAMELIRLAFLFYVLRRASRAR